MKRYNLGIEEATKAIVVSKAMRRAMIACESPAQAVEILTSKISLSNLLYDSSDEGVNEDMSSIRPELRVEPVVTSRKTRQAAAKAGKQPGSSSSSQSSSSSSRSNKPMTGRKRSIEEIASRAEKKETRGRADSVAEEVEEKINAKKSSTEDDSNSDSSSTTTSLRTPVVRGKRGIRVDDSDTQTHKRIRGSDIS